MNTHCPTCGPGMRFACCEHCNPSVVSGVTPPTPPTRCPFCDYRGPSGIIAQIPGVAYVIDPINPVAPGHRLVISWRHAEDFAADRRVTGAVMDFAAHYAAETYGDCNLITSRGAAATQTVRHLHVHLIPRVEGDGLALPWTEAPGV